MAIQIINTGTSANAGNGDSIRTAFQKVNFNFDYLEGLALGTSTSLTSSVQSVVRPMLVHDAHNGISASYNSINNRVILALGNLNLFTATNIVVNTLTVINSAVMNDVVMSGKVYMGFVQGTDDINVVKYADDGSLTLSLKNTYGLGGSEIELEDNISGSFRIVHQNSGANRDQFQNGQNYIYDDLGRGINIGRNSTVSIFAKNTFTNYSDPELRISTTGTFISNNLTIADTSINWGGNNFTYNADNELLLGNQYVRARTDRLTSGLYTASLTTAGNLLLPGDIVLELDTRIPNGLTVTNYGSTFSSIGPFAGVGSFYFDGSSYLSVSGGSHFNLFTTTSTLEWFERRTIANPVTDLTSWALGSAQQPTLDFTTFTAGTFTNSGVFFGGDIGLSFLSASLYNNWTHYAAVISTSSFKLFVNGAIQINTTDTSFLSTLTYSGGNFSIGGIIDDNDLVAPFQGYISNMRWDAREVYTATFVPPTSILTRNSSTRMLLQTEKFTNFIYDSSLPGFSQLQQVQLVISTSSFIFNEQGQFIINQNLPYQGQELAGTSIRVDTDSDFYTQAIIKNASAATTATSDLIFVRNDGNAATGIGVLDIGINSSNYTEPGPYGIHTPGSAYMFSNDADLIIGTQSAGKVVKFHAGETTSSNAIAVFASNGMTFNKQLLVTENYPGILVIQTQNTNPSGSGAAFSAINDNSGYINFGINGTTASINANIGPSDPYINPQSSGDTLHIGAGLNIAFYSDNVFYNNGTATLFLSRVDQSATFAGHVLPDSDLAYDLGSTSSQWRSLYVGTSTVYFGGTPFTVSADGTISVAGNEVIATTGVTSITAGTGTAISTSTGAVTIWATGGSGAGIATTSTLVNGTYTVSLSNAGQLTVPGPINGLGNSKLDFTTYGSNSAYLTTTNDDSTALFMGAVSAELYANTYVSIRANTGGTSQTWTFNDDGNLTLPSGGEITSNQITNEIFGTTTTSLTLVPGGATEAGQRLEIYATIGGEGNHLHLTAGESPTELYLGNDSQYVKLGSMGQIEISAQGGLTLWGEGVMSNAYLILPNNIDSSSTNVTLGNVNGDVNITTNNPFSTSTWSFGTMGELTLPNGATIVDTTSTLVLTPNSPAQVTSLVLRSTYNSYMTADYPTDQGYQQYLHELDPVTYPDPYVSTGTEGTVISITLWDASGLQYVQGDVEYIITGTGITAADFTPAVLTGTFAAANWTLDGGGFNYTNTNMLMIANDAIVEGEETFTITIVTTGTYAPGAGSNYLRVNIADGTTEGSESGHIHLISENMAQTSIFLGNDDKYVKVAADDQIYIKVPNSDTSGTSQLWTFGTDGSTTLPIGVSIDESNGSHFPRIVADSGKAFSVQGQGSTGSAAIAWLDYESTSSQYAAVGVNGTGTDNLAKVVLVAGSSTPTLKVWRFDETGVITFPDTTVQTTAWTGTVSLNNVSGLTTATTATLGLVKVDGTTITINNGVISSAGGGGGGAASTVDITDTNGLTTIYYPTFVENRTTGQTVRADVDLTYRTDDNLLGVGNISVNGTTNSTGTTTGALTVVGGVGVGGGMFVGGTVTAATFVGNLTGTASTATYATSFNTSTLVANAVNAQTVTTAAQPNITSVGTLTSLSVSGTITALAATATVNSTAASVGYMGLPQNSTGTTTLSISDAGKHIYITTSSQTITIPANSSVPYPIGTAITFIAGPSATTVTIAITSDTMRLAGAGTTGSRTLAAHGMATAVKVAATTWYINGTGLT
jgi:hypothetical protein